MRWGQPPLRRRGRLGRAPAVAMVIHILAACVLMPVAGHPYDLAALTSSSGAWLRWGVPLFYHWKFGFDLTTLAVGAQSLSFVLEHLGMSGAAALAVAWKLPLVLADLLVGAILVDLGRQMRCQRPALMPTLWLASPVPLWVSAGHGQVESLTILSIVLSLDLLLRNRPLLAGVVAGLGIGIEYLPALVALVVIFWLYVSVLNNREVYRFVAGCAGALAFCFGPSLSTYLGRISLLGGLSFTAAVTSHSGNLGAASRAGSSLWTIFDASPGSFWVAALLATSVALVIVLARMARRAESTTNRKRLGILAAGGLLLCVALLDPGALPQFSVLVLGGLCTVGLCVELSPAVIIFGPSLQLAAGFIFVYGGDFQSYWYDMWVMTGVSGWPFPQSPLVADWLARLGAVVVALGLLFALTQILGSKISERLRSVVARLSIAAGVLSVAFLVTWSLQPAFWQGVGPRGPSTLADFSSITAFQRGAVSTAPNRTLISFPPQEVLAARESTIPPSLKLTVGMRPFFAQTTANAVRPGDGAGQTLTIPGWVRERTQVHSLWVSVLLGKPAWRSGTAVLGGVPTLVVQSHRLDHRVRRPSRWDRPAARARTGAQPVHLRDRLRQRPREGQKPGAPRNRRPPAVRPLIIPSSEVTWVAPGWAVVTYEFSASMVSRHGGVILGFRESHRGGGVTEWNGSPHARWVFLSLRSGTVTMTINGTRWHGPVTLSSPAQSWWSQHVEDVTIQGIPLNPHRSVSVSRLLIGGKRGEILGGGLAWPSPGGLDHTISGPILSAFGGVNVVALLGGAFGLGRWAAGTRRPHVRSNGRPTEVDHPRGRHRAGDLPHPGLSPEEAAE